MVTTSLLGKQLKADQKGDCSLGNAMFRIASVIGIATKNGYHYGFPEWLQQEYFVNPLPRGDYQLPKYTMKPTYSSFDFGFQGFDIPDNVDIRGELASYKYFEHCKALIRYYFTLKPQCEPFKDCILIHFRDYRSQGHNGGVELSGYYQKALKYFPKKRIIVVTGNIEVAQKCVNLDCEYTSNSPIVDFYLLANTDYLIMGNSTFSWWGSYLSKSWTIAPGEWFVNKDIKLDDFYLPEWIVI